MYIFYVISLFYESDNHYGHKYYDFVLYALQNVQTINMLLLLSTGLVQPMFCLFACLFKHSSEIVILLYAAHSRSVKFTTYCYVSGLHYPGTLLSVEYLNDYIPSKIVNPNKKE